MLNELEQKIRKAIPKTKKWEYGKGIIQLPIQLNHVLMYASGHKYLIVDKWNLKSNLLSDQREEMWRFLLELKKD